MITLATTVPTFFIRLKPTSSMANPACMNMTKTPVTITQIVSEAMSAVVGLGASAAKAATGRRAKERAAKVANAIFLLIAPTLRSEQ